MKLTAPLVATLEEQYQRRDNAIDAVSAYCLVQEGCTVCVPHCRSTLKAAAPDLSYDLAEGSPLYHATLSIFATSKLQPRRCFICVGQAMDLPPDDGHQVDGHQVDDLTCEFYTPSDLSKHFQCKHLSKVASSDKPECRVCNMMLEHKMRLQNHALMIYGTVS